MSKKNMKIIVVAPVGWNDYPSLKKALDALLQPYDGPQFEIEIVVPNAVIGLNKLPQLWAAERGYRMVQFSMTNTSSYEAWTKMNLDLVGYCEDDLESKLIAFYDGSSPEIMHLIGMFQELISEEGITMITV